MNGELSPTAAEHLGDGAYATITPHHLILCAGHHLPSQASDEVYLEPSVIRALVEYIKRNNPDFLE